MCNRFIKFIPSEEAFWLMENKPNAFRLLAHIANTARRTPGHPDGLSIGQCHLQSWKSYKLTEKQYRTAKQILVMRKHIRIILTNRTRQKSATGSATNSTLVEICNGTIWDINPESEGDSIGDRGATEGRPKGDKQEVKKVKKEKENRGEGEAPPSPIPVSFPKVKFRELVELTQEQHDSLLAIHGQEFLTHMLDVLDAYKGSNNATYKSDYHVMKQGGWVIDRARKSFKQDTKYEKPFPNAPESNKPNPPAKFVGRVLRGSNTGGKEAHAS